MLSEASQKHLSYPVDDLTYLSESSIETGRDRFPFYLTSPSVRRPFVIGRHHLGCVGFRRPMKMSALCQMTLRGRFSAGVGGDGSANEQSREAMHGQCRAVSARMALYPTTNEAGGRERDAMLCFERGVITIFVVVIFICGLAVGRMCCTRAEDSGG